MDRAGDALKHGNAYGASPHGGVLMVAGDDHGCVSSSMPHQSDQAFQSWHAPIVSPANVAEYLEFGLYGWALSRFSGNWVGFTALSEVVESGSTVDLDLVNARGHLAGRGHRARHHRLRSRRPGLHYRWPDLPSLTIEQRLHAKLDGARLRARQQHRPARRAERARHGGHRHRRQGALRLHGGAAAAGHRARDAGRARRAHHKLGLTYPIERTRMQEFVRGLKEVLVIEEKGPVVEEQMRSLFYNAASGR